MRRAWYATNQSARKLPVRDFPHRLDTVERVLSMENKVSEPEITEAQTHAMWLWAEQVADFLNQAGLDQRVVLNPAMPIPWTKTAVVDQMWRPVQKAMTGETSTKKLKKNEVSDIHETIHRYIAQSQGVNLPQWPQAREYVP